MAIQVTDVTIIAVTAVGANLMTGGIAKEQRDTIRIIEIVGGLMMAQLAKKANTKAAGAGIMTGALVGYINDFLGIGGTKLKIGRQIKTYQQLTYNPPPTSIITENEDIYKEVMII